MHQEYLDSIGFYQCYCHPHSFAMMTCNPNWCEIQENLKDGETPLDRPDLVQETATDQRFGYLKMIARTHSIEFQERGFLIWM